VDPALFAQELRAAGIALSVKKIERGTLHGTVSGVQVSIIEYGYPLLEQPGPFPEHGDEGGRATCLIASADDLACMKLSALAQRGAKKDFFDVYALGLRHHPLAEMLALYRRKYGVGDVAHVLYALAHFDDADRERTPPLLWTTDWRTVKETIRRWVRAIARE